VINTAWFKESFGRDDDVIRVRNNFLTETKATSKKMVFNGCHSQSELVLQAKR
jgi:hypothetical protein